MKKRIIKSLILGMVLVNLLPAVNANASSIEIYINPGTSVIESSDQWVLQDNGWYLATPGFHQAYANVWALVDGKWYFLDTHSRMLADMTVVNAHTGKKYHLNPDGSLLVNSTYNDGVFNYNVDSNGELHKVESTFDPLNPYKDGPQSGPIR